ncbi:MAG: filamentous hemagglutinin N-terminal domain-containing protein, partial [Limnoraphis robusta]
MGSRLSTFSVVAAVTTVFSLTPLTTVAQIVPDNSLGNENSVVTPNVNIRGINSNRIDGGAVRGGNLFHSFQEFNIREGRGAYFSNPDNIINILTRVTGGNISEILGTLGVLGNANLFLINPNGIVFGPNARLDVGGSFFATTADGI